MYKTRIFCFLIGLIPLISHAQDSLSKGEKQVIRIFGDLFNEARKKALEDMRTNGNRSIIGNALRETMAGIAKRSKDRILAGGIDNIIVRLPDAIEQNKQILINKGKSNLLTDFTSSLSVAARNALLNSIVKMVEQVTELDVNALVHMADDESLQITDLFKNMQHTKLVAIAKPFAKTAFKLSGGKKLYKKIDREIKNSEGKRLHIDNEEYLATVATDLFFDYLAREEKNMKQNPLNILDGLIDLLFKKG
jgi:hypothetical protein